MRPSLSSFVLTAAIALSSLTAQAAEPPSDTPAEAPIDAPTPPTPADVGADETEGDPAEVPVKPRKSSKKKSKSRNAEACDYRTPLHEHVVAVGEHVGLIAGLYGVMSKDIIALNPALADNPNHIRIGQKLAICPEIPPREVLEFEYEVQPGDTFNAIAHAQGLEPAELLELQGDKLSNPNKLRVGHSLRIVTIGEILPGFEPEPPQAGRLANARKLPEHRAYTIKRDHHVYGTARTIRLISQVVDRYTKRADGGPKLRIGDISKNHGGPLGGHLSHQEGNDLDIGIVLTGEAANRLHFSGANANNIDLARTWLLIEEFIATGEVRVIYLDYEIQALLYDYAKQNGVAKAKLDEYFQYPRGTGRTRGLIRHWRGHKNHLHVRFRG
jgi:LysM repeat protein